MKLEKVERTWLAGLKDPAAVIEKCCEQIDKDFSLAGMRGPVWSKPTDLDDVRLTLTQFIEGAKNKHPNWDRLKYHMDVAEWTKDGDEEAGKLAEIICYHALRKVWFRTVHAQNQ